MNSIIIPAYNEEFRIKKTLEDYIKAFPKSEFIIVCDGTDRTAEIVKSFSKNNIKIKVLVFNRRLGKGGAVYKGFDAAKGDTIGFTDSDESVKPSEYKKLLTYSKNYDCVIASRRVKGAKILNNRPWHIVLASITFNKIVNILFNIDIKDTQCGAKVMKKEVYEKIKKEFVLNGFEFDVELLWRIKKAGFSIKEVPIKWAHDPHSKTMVTNHPNLLYQIIKLRLHG